MEECVQYLDDILVCCGNTEAEHQEIVEKVLQQCIEHGLVVNVLKSEFQVHKSIIREHVINKQEVIMDPSKLKTMFKWPMPRMKKKVEVFLGFGKYYTGLIVDYNAKARPLIDLMNDVPFSWRHIPEQACN